MKLNRNWGWILAGVFTAGVLWAWLAGGRPHRLTIAIHESIEGDALREIAKRFSTAHKIEVQVLQFSYDDLYEKEMAQLQQQRNPADKMGEDQEEDATPAFDVIMADDPWMPALTGKVNPEDKSRLERLNISDADDFPQPVLQVAKYCPGGNCPSEYYGVPFVGNSQLFCYRTADFPKPEMVPATWDAVVQFVKNHRNQPGTHDARPYVGRIGPGNSIVTDFISLLWSRDASVFPEILPNPKPSAAQPLALGDKGKAALDDLKALVGDQNGSTSVDDFDLAAYMLKEKASMAIVWSAWAMMIENMRPQGSTDLQFTSVPGGSTPELGVWLLAIPEGSGMKEDAKEFIKFATSQEQLLRAALIGNPPPRKSILRHPGDIARHYPDLTRQSVYDQLRKYEGSFAYQLDSLERARPRPRTPRWREIECILGKYLGKVVVENMDTKLAVEQVDSKLKQCTTSLTSPCEDPPECHSASPHSPVAQD